MVRIQFTNIIIDNFNEARKEPSTQFVHILTHIHTDHLKGLSDSWSFGPIYCSPITQRLLLQRFPNLRCTIALQLNKQHILKLSSSLEVCATFFDANHCAGAVLVLLQGYMGTVLHTGDMRFAPALFQSYTYLYPPQLHNQSFEKCSKHIDILFFDNTFLNPRFSFPPAAQALSLAEDYIRDIIENKSAQRIYIGLDCYGKEEVLVHLARVFSTLVVVDEVRYEALQAMQIDLQLFTTNREEGFIQVVAKRSLPSLLKEESQARGMILTGWVTVPTYRGRTYCVPYSLHSNYSEIYGFMRSIRASTIYPIVMGSEVEEDQHKTYDPTYYEKEIQQMRETLTVAKSSEFQVLLNNKEYQMEIMRRLKEETTVLASGKQGMAPVEMQFGPRKKYKLEGRRNQEEIERFKNKLENIKRMKQPIDIFQSSQEEDQAVKRINGQGGVVEKENRNLEEIQQKQHQGRKQQQKQHLKKYKVLKRQHKQKIQFKEVMNKEVDVFEFINLKGSQGIRQIIVVDSKEKAEAYLQCDRRQLKQVLQKLIKALKV